MMTAAGITISDKTIGIWRVELPGGNWLAHLFVNAGATPMPGFTTWGGVSNARRLVAIPGPILTYRFRWENDRGERPWTICGVRPGTPDADAIEKVRRAQDNLMTYGLGGWEVLRGDRSVAEFFAALHKMPGMSATAGPEVIRLLERATTPPHD